MATENSESSSTSLIQIATNGDVVLVVSENKRRLQVCSSILKNGSNYFDKMFGPHFSEGQDLTANNRKEILMPEDNANALEIICNILHLRNDAVPEALDPTEVFEVAVTADKLDCVVAMKHLSALWLKPKEGNSTAELGYLMAASYFLDNARAFSEITLSMVVHHNASFLSLVDDDIGLDDTVLLHIICLLEERRNQMRTGLQDILLDGVNSAGSEDAHGCSCAWSSRHSSAYLQLLQDENLWQSKMIQVSISQVLDKLKRMDDPTMPHGWVPCSYRWHVNAKYREMPSYRLDELLKRNNGLCIDCIRSKTTGAKRNCRVEHGNH